MLLSQLIYTIVQSRFFTFWKRKPKGLILFYFQLDKVKDNGGIVFASIAYGRPPLYLKDWNSLCKHRIVISICPLTNPELALQATNCNGHNSYC